MSEKEISNVAMKRKADQLSEEEEDPFTQRGKCDDEVTFLFDDEKELYVSRNLLCYASTVFDAMFKSDFKEKKSGVVEMKEKSYEDILEFLLTLHPDVQKQITEENVYIILSLAEEYQAKRAIRLCKDVLAQKLQSELKTVITHGGCWFSDESLRTVATVACFKVLSTAMLYGYDKIKNDAIGAIARFVPSVYLEVCLVTTRAKHYKSAFGFGEIYLIDTDKEKCLSKMKECKDSFDALPVPIQMQILRERIMKADDGKPK